MSHSDRARSKRLLDTSIARLRVALEMQGSVQTDNLPRHDPQLIQHPLRYRKATQLVFPEGVKLSDPCADESGRETSQLAIIHTIDASIELSRVG